MGLSPHKMAMGSGCVPVLAMGSRWGGDGQIWGGARCGIEFRWDLGAERRREGRRRRW